MVDFHDDQVIFLSWDGGIFSIEIITKWGSGGGFLLKMTNLGQ